MPRPPWKLLAPACAVALVLAVVPATSTGRPSPTALPVVTVETGAELARALGRRSPTVIVLEDGVYGHETVFTAHAPHRIAARHAGRARLTAGLVVGGDRQAGGTRIRGLVFDVRDPAKTMHGALVHVWGRGGADTRVTDSILDGNGVITYGLNALNPDGLVAERLSFRDLTDVALRASDNKTVAYGTDTPRIASIADITVVGVGRAVPGESTGSAEAGLWIGHPVADGVRRILVRGVSWAGIETVNNSWDTTFADLDIDMSGPRSAAAVGVYLEHHSIRNTFERFTIRGASAGFRAEWADPAWGGVAAAHDTVIRDGLIDAAGAVSPHTWGVYLDEGTASTTITGVTFRNQSVAAIGAYRTSGVNRFELNDTEQLLPGAVPYSDAHWSSPP